MTTKTKLYLVITFFLGLAIHAYYYFHRAEIHAYLTGPNQSTHIENQDSMLLKYLVDQERFPDDYMWFHLTTMQNPITPATDNQFQNEEASVKLFGLLNGKEVTIDNTVRKYQFDPNFVNLVNATDFHAYENIPGHFSPKIDRVAAMQVETCVHFIENRTTCLVLFSQGKIFVEIKLDVKEYVDEQLVESMLNSLLGSVDIK